MVSQQKAVGGDFFKVYVGNLSGSSLLDGPLSLNHCHCLSAAAECTQICCSPELYFPATMENDISTIAHAPVFLYQCAHVVTDLLPSVKTFTVVTEGGCRSNAVSYLHMLEASSWMPIHTCHSNNHWIFFFLSFSGVIEKKSYRLTAHWISQRTFQ